MKKDQDHDAFFSQQRKARERASRMAYEKKLSIVDQMLKEQAETMGKRKSKNSPVKKTSSLQTEEGG